MESMRLDIQNIIGDVVCEVNKNILEQVQKNESCIYGYPSTIQGIWYEHGHILEIGDTLQEKSIDLDKSYQKYPAIFLIEDIDYQMGVGYGREEWDYTAYLDVLIVHQTKREYKAMERDRYVFEPVLVPIYNEFMKQVVKHPEIMVEHNVKMLQHTVTPRKYWGTHYIQVMEKGQKDRGVEKNIILDYVDALDIRGLRLVVSESCKDKIYNKISN